MKHWMFVFIQRKAEYDNRGRKSYTHSQLKVGLKSNLVLGASQWAIGKIMFLVTFILVLKWMSDMDCYDIHPGH